MRPETTIARFYSRIRKTPSGCWEWTGSLMPNGYGQFRGFGQQYAHRVSYVIHHGPLMTNACVMHKCDNRPCVNPSHLSMGTLDDNNQDMFRKGRGKKGKRYVSHCPQGHMYDDLNTLVRKSGARTCRTCKRNQEMTIYYRKKATRVASV